jgi:hypothetical protein
MQVCPTKLKARLSYGAANLSSQHDIFEAGERSKAMQPERRQTGTAARWSMRSLLALVTTGCLTGCASLLPTSKTEMKMPWQNYAEAKATFDRIIVQRTTIDELNAMAINADVTPNIVSLNHTDLLRRLANVPLLDPGMLDDGLRACLIKRQKCTGLEIEQTHTERERIGSFWLDVLGFRQDTSVTGWRFNAVIVLDENVVIFKVWSGQPNIRRLEEERNPLGPLQGVGAALIRKLY